MSDSDNKNNPTIYIHIIGASVVLLLVLSYIFRDYVPPPVDSQFLKDSETGQGSISTIKLIDPESGNMYHQAYIAHESKQFSKAESIMIEFTKIYPFEPEGFDFLGVIMSKENRYLEARQYYNKALEIDSSLAGTYANLGALTSNENDYYVAIEFYKKAIQLDSNSSSAHYGIANDYYYVDSLRKAKDHYKKVVQLVSGSYMTKDSKTNISKIDSILKQRN
jgi:tetratricopeptide (TPR) repeat protein